jgi:hypothetical protein
MNENAKKWVEALRSGEFKQARERLRKDRAFCCLGVACELYRRDTGLGTWNQYGFKSPSDLSEDVLPIDVQRWLELAGPSGQYATSGLATDNDRGAPFEEIANTIESEPPGLFA